MPTKVIMPQLGESVVEGTITQWLKSIGDPVQEYEPIIEINTDKVDTEIPSPTSGILLATLVEPGETITVGTILGWIGQPGETIPEGGMVDQDAGTEVVLAEIKSEPESRLAPSITPPVVVAPGRDRELGFISPVVARIASQFKVDLRQVQGSGQGGRITKNDILAYVENQQEISESVPLIATEQAKQPPPTPPFALPALSGKEQLLPLTPVRKSIAEHMVFSKHTSPHVTTVMEVDLSRIVAHRASNKDVFARDGVNLTFTAYFVAAACIGLKAYPIVNSSWSNQGIVLHPQINIGMATSLGEEGLIVPVIKGADNMSILGLARVINDLASRARAKKLQPDEVKGGTFTITNHGISGSLFATPIISQPQCAILGVGAIQKRVVVISDEILGDTIAIRPMAYLTLTFDHRILDGAIADYFLSKVVEALESW